MGVHLGHCEVPVGLWGRVWAGSWRPGGEVKAAGTRGSYLHTRHGWNHKAGGMEKGESPEGPLGQPMCECISHTETDKHCTISLMVESRKNPNNK